jgi:hypothetical protein
MVKQIKGFNVRVLLVIFTHTHTHTLSETKATL